MNLNDDSKRWWESPKVVIAILTVVAGAGLVSVFLPLGLSWGAVLSSKKAQFYVTEVGVPLLTFSGFLAVYLGFLSQREQNELQERQLETQRKQIEAQQANFQKDRFESTFFQLLHTHNQIVNGIQCEEWRQEKWALYAGEADLEPNRIGGRMCFEQFYSELKRLFEEKSDELDWSDEEKGEISNFRRVYGLWWEEHKHDLNHYFNFLSKIILFIDNNKYAIEDESLYIDLIIGQMSVPETRLFFYHTASKRNVKGYATDVNELLSKYTFFRQLDKKFLIHESHDQFHPHTFVRF